MAKYLGALVTYYCTESVMETLTRSHQEKVTSKQPNFPLLPKQNLEEITMMVVTAGEKNSKKNDPLIVAIASVIVP
jgi:hypothetical protein